MNTKKFNCVPDRAYLQHDGNWRIRVDVITDYSQHTGFCTITDENSISNTHGRYGYDETQKIHLQAVAMNYKMKCEIKFEEFKKKHNLDAHKAETIEVNFNEEAEITTITEEFNGNEEGL